MALTSKPFVRVTQSTDALPKRNSLAARYRKVRGRVLSLLVMDHQEWWAMPLEEFQFNRLTLR